MAPDQRRVAEPSANLFEDVPTNEPIGLLFSWLRLMRSIYWPISIDISLPLKLREAAELVKSAGRAWSERSTVLTWSVSIRVTFWTMRLPHLRSTNCTLFSALYLLVEMTSLKVKDKMVC